MKKITFDNKNARFYQELKKRVNEYFVTNNLKPTANTEMKIKTAVVLTSFFGCYAALVFFSWPWYITLALCVAMALSVAGIGFNIMHDAAHRSYSKRAWVNTVLAYTLDLIGGSVALWKTKHNVIHHTYTNIPRWDGDIAQDAIIRLAPQQPYLKIHRFQHIYAFFLYSLLSLLWIYFGDFQKLATRKIESYPLPRLSRKELFVLFAFKIFHLFYALVLPCFFHPWWGVLLCYLFINLIIGFILSVVFQLAHIYENTEYPEPDPETHKINNEWAKHQLATTANFGVKNRILSWCIGGLNFQVEHHLFPHICHVHYPKINKILRETCEEFKVKYNEFPSFRSALRAHVRQLYLLGRPEKYAHIS
ncbi:MAG: acyl-CoA desaturase [Bacteroidia bacterium]|nr:acyl-CoA desaturase [Bacteroidia bacterium]